MLTMPSIMVRVYFEANLGQYFEVIMHWHRYPEELSWFCIMLQLHQLYFNFIAPFWEKARLNPRNQLKQTYTKYVESQQVDELDHQEKLEQFEEGICKRHAERNK
jgi:hypothetical protein